MRAHQGGSFAECAQPFYLVAEDAVSGGGEAVSFLDELAG